MARGNAEEAVLEYDQALKVVSSLYGPKDIRVSAVLNDLAFAYYASDQLDKAEPLYLRSLAIKESKPNSDQVELATTLDNLGVLYAKMNQHGKAEPYHLRALKIYESKLGPDHPEVAACLNNLAAVYRNRGEYARAEPLYRRSLAIKVKELGDGDPALAAILNNLAVLEQEMGRYDKAEPLLQRSLKISEAKFGPDHPHVASQANVLAALYVEMARYDRAEPLLLRSLAIVEARLGPNHTEVADSLDGLAGLYQKMNQPAKAEPLYRRSLAIDRANHAPDRSTAATTLNNLGLLCYEGGRYAEAETLLRDALKLKESLLGRDHISVAASLNNLALVEMALGQSEAAEPLYRRALAIVESKLGADNPRVAYALNNLAGLYQDRGDSDRAEPLFTRALAIREAKLGTEHPDVATSLDELARLHAGLGRWSRAAETFDRERRVSRRHIARILPMLPEAEQLAFLRSTDEQMLSTALSFGLARRDDRDTAERSAGWVLNGKAVAQQALAQRALLSRDARDPASAQTVKELTDVRSRLAAMTIEPAEPGREAEHRRERDRLAEQERSLAGRLGRASGLRERDDPWVELAEVRKAVPADAVLIEIAGFVVAKSRVRAGEKRWQPPRYVAWVIPPPGRGDVRIVDLGEAGPIEGAVAAARQAIQEGPAAARDRGEPEAEEALRGPLDALASKVLAPLLPHIRDAKRWLLSPDAALWLVPWSALPLGDHRYVVEDHEVRYLVSGRDLTSNAASLPTGKAIMMANPDYNLDPRKARDGALQVLRRPTTPAPAEGLLALRGAPRSLSNAVFAALPGSAAEARAVAPKLEAYAGSAPLVYTGPWALEAVFKAFVRPRVLVLSTHGYFLDTPDERTATSGNRSAPSAAGVSENPLLQCGLALAGANRRGQATGPNEEDGILTGLEVIGTDLRGTELVVLSACETGLGQVHVGEGVSGLRQAFQLAGAKSVVATLWQIPDLESARLMASFFDGLAAGKGQEEALGAAQRAQIEARRKRNGAAHPFFWAAFTLTGADVHAGVR